MTPFPDLDEGLHQLRAATQAKKCWTCNCFHSSLRSLERELPADRRPPVLNEAVTAAQAVLQPIRYECLGCDPCHPPQALNALGVAGEACGAAPVESRAGWPPLPGSYHVLRYSAPVAICTLTDENLAHRIAAAGSPQIAITGPMQTENLGIERLIANLVANPNIRFLILCGNDTEKAVGHRPGASLAALARSGLDGASRIIDAPGRRPVIKNLDSAAVERFRQQVEIVDRIGNADIPAILHEVASCAARSPGPATPFASARQIETITGRVPERMVSDPSGYVVIDVDRANRQLVVEHYTTAGVLDLIIRGATANEVMAPVFARNLVSRLDHAGYVGKELTRAEAALRSGDGFTQDAAPEQRRVAIESAASCGSGCACYAPPAPTSNPHADCGCAPQLESSMTTRTKPVLVVVGLLALTAVALGLRTTRSSAGTAESPANPPANAVDAPLGINAFMQMERQPKEAVAVQGVVNGHLADQHLLLLVDDADGACAGQSCCAPLILPVRWPGTVPTNGTAVIATGQFGTEGGKQVFLATSVAPRGGKP
ncbi:MAG: hypothetical protein L6R48_01030 [Planctomycetes bacterium]|nr:hypothetical protein [Planctomycetota bacterium]